MDEKEPAKALTIDQRKQLGTNKKLWRVEVLFYEDDEIKRYHLSNWTGKEVRNFRENVFLIGFMYPVSPGEYRVIAPSELSQLNIFKQSKFFDL